LEYKLFANRAKLFYFLRSKKINIPIFYISNTITGVHTLDYRPGIHVFKFAKLGSNDINMPKLSRRKPIFIAFSFEQRLLTQFYAIPLAN